MPASKPNEIPALPRLAFAPLESLRLHEAHDERRAPFLQQRMLESQLFRHPLTAAPLGGAGDELLVLDGANRTVALQRLGMRHALVQIAQPDDPGLTLDQWNHVLYGWETPQLIQRLKTLAEIKLLPDLDGPHEPGSATGRIDIRLPGGIRLRAVPAAGGLAGKVAALNAVVNAYAALPGLDRTHLADLEELAQLYPGLTALVVMPTLRLDELQQMAAGGLRLPTGVTRTIISPRALGVNVPLDWLQDDRPLAEKNAALQALIEARMAAKQVRYYGEAIVMYDE